MILVRVPFKSLMKYEKLIRERGLFVELTLEYDDVYNEELDFYDVGGFIKSVHLPFWDINLGSKNFKVRELSKDILRYSLTALRKLSVKNVVLHHNYENYHYGFDYDTFLKNFTDSLESLIVEFDNSFQFAIENVFDDRPEIIRDILERLKNYNVRTCFDFGHFNLFSVVSLEYWFENLADYIVEFHVHNNYGVRDEHNSLDRGTFDYEKAFKLKKPEFITIENNSIEDFDRSVKILKKFL